MSVNNIAIKIEAAYRSTGSDDITHGKEFNLGVRFRSWSLI